MLQSWRIIDIINWAESYFKEKGFENPRIEIEWLLCSILQCGRLDLYLRFEETSPTPISAGIEFRKS